MNIHYFKHVPFEGLGCMNSWVKKPGNMYTATKFYEDHNLPYVDICELLIVMGGPMGANDEAKYPWLKEEKKFIEKAIEKGKKIVGICLGAQLIADVLGAKVYKNHEKEIGWLPVEFTDEARSMNLFDSFPQKQTVFHWHGDTFDLPQGAVHIAKSEGCANQSFLYKNQVLGLQFHLEATDHSIKKMLAHCREELVEGKYIQSEEDILKGHEHMFSSNNLMISIVNKMVQR